jgi:hypothetical protein
MSGWMGDSRVVLGHVLYFKSCERLLIRQDLFALDIFSSQISFKTSLSLRLGHTI